MYIGRPLAAALALTLAGTLTSTPAEAATITLSPPLTGSAAGPFVDLTVAFDANGSGATNITGWEVYVAFSGLSPIDASFALGNLFQPFEDDVIEVHGTCADGAPCNSPADPSSSGQWVSLASVFPPHLPEGPGTMFRLRFAVAPLSADWSLTVFGESAAPTVPCGTSSALLWDSPVDGPCPIVPFAIVPAETPLPWGIARIAVSAVPTGSVPEPPVVALLVAGLALWRSRSRVL